MSHNKLQGYEKVYVHGDLFIFKGDFSFLATLTEISEIDPIFISERIDSLNPESVKNVLIASLDKKGGIKSDDIPSEDKEIIIENLITDFGLQECGILARNLLSNAMLGKIKKNAIETHQNVQSLLNNFVLSRSKIFTNHALLWGYLAAIFGIFVCMSIKLLGLHICLN